MDLLGLSCNVGDCRGSTGNQKNKSSAGILVAHEKVGGRLIKKHLGSTDEQLAAGFELEPNIPASSTFTALDEAETIVSRGLASHQQELIDFQNGGKSKMVIKNRSSYPEGVSVLKGAKESIPVYKFVSV